MRDRPVAEIWTFTRDNHATGEIRTRNSSKRSVADPAFDRSAKQMGCFEKCWKLTACEKGKSAECVDMKRKTVYTLCVTVLSWLVKDTGSWAACF